MKRCRRSGTPPFRAQLREAVAAVEETNRVVGLSRLVEQVRTSGRTNLTTLSVMEAYRRNTSAQADDAFPYAAWGLRPQSG